MMTNQEIIDVVAHFYTGGKVQADCAQHQTGWVDCPAPVWDFINNIYRPKPEPQTYWAVLDEDGYGHIRPTKEDAEKTFARVATTPFANVTIKQLVEVQP
jgi:hypothetical protein